MVLGEFGDFGILGWNCGVWVNASQNFFGICHFWVSGLGVVFPSIWLFCILIMFLTCLDGCEFCDF